MVLLLTNIYHRQSGFSTIENIITHSFFIVISSEFSFNWHRSFQWSNWSFTIGEQSNDSFYHWTFARRSSTRSFRTAIRHELRSNESTTRYFVDAPRCAFSQFKYALHQSTTACFATASATFQRHCQWPFAFSSNARFSSNYNSHTRHSLTASSDALQSSDANVANHWQWRIIDQRCTTKISGVNPTSRERIGKWSNGRWILRPMYKMWPIGHRIIGGVSSHGRNLP